MPLVFFQRNIVTSGFGSRLEIQQMLDFTARHRIHPQVELFPMSEVNTAFKRLRKNEIRYRAVLTH